MPEQTLQMGEMVWRRNVQSEQRKGGQLDPDYLSHFHFVETKIEGKCVNLVDSEGHSILKANIDHVRKPMLPR